MRAITALSIASDAIRAAVIADPIRDSPTIKHFQALPLPPLELWWMAKWWTPKWSPVY